MFFQARNFMIHILSTNRERRPRSSTISLLERLDQGHKKALRQLFEGITQHLPRLRDPVSSRSLLCFHQPSCEQYLDRFLVIAGRVPMKSRLLVIRTETITVPPVGGPAQKELH